MFVKLSLIYLLLLFIMNGFQPFTTYWNNYNVLDNLDFTFGLYDHQNYNKLLFDIHSIGHLNWGIISSIIFNYNFLHSNLFHITWELYENSPISVYYYNKGILDYPDTFLNTFSDHIFFLLGFYISKKLKNKKISILIYLVIDFLWIIMNTITTPVGCFINFWTLINLTTISGLVYSGYLVNN